MQNAAQLDQPQDEFLSRLHGLLYSLLSWQQLTNFWAKVDRNAGWYLYAVGEEVPAQPASPDQVEKFIAEIDALLRRDHHENYCGIVYADNLEQPSFVKIYDPNHLGSSCGSSATKSSILPGWLMSRTPPRALEIRGVVTGQRKRWWQSFLASPA